MVGNDKIPRIIARRKRDCTDRVKSMAKAVLQCLIENRITVGGSHN